MKIIKGIRSLHLRKINRTGILLTSIFLVSSLTYSWISVTRHHRFQTREDLAIYDQVFWFLSNLKWPYLAFDLNRPYWGDHLSIIYLLFVPLYKVYSHPETLLVLQSFIAMSTIFPLFFISKRLTGSTVISYVLILCFILYVPLQNGILYDFHELLFVPVVFTLCYYFFLMKNKVPVTITLLLLLAIKEDRGLLVAAFGAYLMLCARSWRLYGLGWVCIGILYTYIVTEHVIPAIGGNYFFQFEQGMSFSVMIVDILKNPVNYFIKFLDEPVKVQTLFSSYRQFLFLPLLSPFGIILSLGDLIPRFFANKYALWTTQYHYSAAIASIVTISTAHVLGNFRNKWKMPEKFLLIFGFLFLGLSIYENIKYSQAFQFIVHERTLEDEAIIRRNGIYRFALALVPDKSSISTHMSILPHVAHREGTYFLDRMDRADYTLIDLSPYQPDIDYYSFPSQEAAKEKVFQDIANNRKKILFQSHDIYLLRSNITE